MPVTVADPDAPAVPTRGRADRRREQRRSRARGLTAAGAVAVLLACGLAEASTGGSHEVTAGETLSGMARRYGVTVADLVAANGLADPNVIVVGTELVIPGATATGAGSGGATSVHHVAAGETLSAIAARYGVTVAQLVDANRISNPNLIIAGTSLEVVGGTTTGAAPAARAPSFVPAARRGLAPSFARWADEYDVDVALLMALAYQESGWQTSVVSAARATGVMQITPATAQFTSLVLLGLPDTLPMLEPDANIRMGARFLAHLLAVFDGDEVLAVAAYNQGPTSVRRDGPQDAVLAFVGNVLALRDRV